MHRSDIYHRIPTLSDDELKQALAWWKQLSATTENPKSPTHKYFYALYAESERRKETRPTLLKL